MNPENKLDFRAEFISFLKSKGYPPSGIFCNAQIGEINVDYLITLPNPNEKLAIITAQRLDDNPAQLRRQVEICRQEIGIPNYPICILTPTTKAQSKYPFTLYYLDNIENFQKINFELLPTFQELSLKGPTLEPPLSAKEMAKSVESTMETNFQALEELPLSAKEFEELPLSAKEIVKPFVPIVTIVIFSLLAIISLLSAVSVSDVLSFLLGFGAFCLITIGIIISVIAFLRSFGSDESQENQECLYCSQKMMECVYSKNSPIQPIKSSDLQPIKSSGFMFSLITSVFSPIINVIILVVLVMFILFSLMTSLKNNEDMFFWWLVIFVVIIYILFLLRVVVKKVVDNSINYHIPSLTALNPYEIATLRNGRKGVIQIALFNLFRKELLMSKEIEEPFDPKRHCVTEKSKNVARGIRCYINDSPTSQPEGVIEEAILKFTQKNQIPKNFFRDLGLRTTLDKLMEPINQKLIQMHLKHPDLGHNDVSPLRSILWQLLFLFLGCFMVLMINELGFRETAIYLTIYLFVICFVMIGINVGILSNEKDRTQTQLGKRYLKQLTEHFQWAQTDKSSGIAPILLVAIYGIQELEDSPDGFGAFSDFSGQGTEEGGCGGCGGCGGGCGGCGGG